MNILFLTAHLPSPVCRQAGQKTTYFACEWLARRGHSVHLLSFATPAELACFRPDDMKGFASYEIVPVTLGSRLTAVLAHPQVPLLPVSRWSGEFQSKLRRLLNAHRFDYAYLDFTGMMLYSSCLKSIPVVSVMEVDVSFRTWERLSECAPDPVRKFAYAFEARRMRSWELRKLRDMDIVLLQSTKEQEMLGELLPGQTFHLLRPWIELHRKRTFVPHAEREPGSLVFWGAMDRQPNCDAVVHAVSDILPRVALQQPQFRYNVVGNAPPEPWRRRFDNSQTMICGFVEDAFAVLSSKRIALLPMRLGAGIKVKVLECMAAGLAVVTTPEGIEGISGREGVHFLVGRSDQELADHVVALLSDCDRAAALGRRAREMVLENHSFESPLARLESLICEKQSVADVIRSPRRGSRPK